MTMTDVVKAYFEKFEIAVTNFLLLFNVYLFSFFLEPVEIKKALGN